MMKNFKNQFPIFLFQILFLLSLSKSNSQITFNQIPPTDHAIISKQQSTLDVKPQLLEVPLDTSQTIQKNSPYSEPQPPSITQLVSQIIFLSSQQPQHEQPLITPPQNTHSQYHHWTEKDFWINVLIASILTCVGGFCSGMAIGMFSIETIQLEIMAMSQDQEEKDIAHRILGVLHNRHLFLVTLLLANAIALQSLPLVIHTLMPAWAAILFSTFIVLIVAEIIPQAYCTGPKKITIAYHASPIIAVMIKAFWIISYPIAKGLDHLLGQHEHDRIQHRDFANFLTGGAQNLKNTEKLLLTSILQLRTKRVPEVMVPFDKLYMLQINQRLTQQKIKQLSKKDYSYILVYSSQKSANAQKAQNLQKNVIGVLKTKQLSKKYLNSQLSGKKVLKIQDFFTESKNILCVYQDTNLLQMLMLFQTRNERYSIVIDKKKKIEPGIQSIMYSKSDMVANKMEGEILGVVFLYRVFEQITEYNIQVANALKIKSNQSNQNLAGNKGDTEMSEIKRPLLH